MESKVQISEKSIEFCNECFKHQNHIIQLRDFLTQNQTRISKTDIWDQEKVIEDLFEHIYQWSSELLKCTLRKIQKDFEKENQVAYSFIQSKFNKDKLAGLFHEQVRDQVASSVQKDLRIRLKNLIDSQINTFIVSKDGIVIKQQSIKTSASEKLTNDFRNVAVSESIQQFDSDISGIVINPQMQQENQRMQSDHNQKKQNKISVNLPSQNLSEFETPKLDESDLIVQQNFKLQQTEENLSSLNKIKSRPTVEEKKQIEIMNQFQTPQSKEPSSSKSIEESKQCANNSVLTEQSKDHHYRKIREYNEQYSVDSNYSKDSSISESMMSSQSEDLSLSSVKSQSNKLKELDSQGRKELEDFIHKLNNEKQTLVDKHGKLNLSFLETLIQKYQNSFRCYQSHKQIDKSIQGFHWTPKRLNYLITPEINQNHNELKECTVHSFIKYSKQFGICEKDFKYCQ